MPFHNLIDKHIPDNVVQQAEGLIAQLTDLLAPHLADLNEEESVRYGSIGEQNKLIVNKVWTYRQKQPELSAAEVDWVEYEADMNDRAFLESCMLLLDRLITRLKSAKILHDHDVYQDALTDYAYAQYLMGRGIPNSIDKVNELKQFFNRSGTGKTQDAVEE